MALPIIQVNSSTGSDTAASGAGPATALTGAGASLNATTAVDLSADAPDLSGVATDGSACLWVKTSSGRQYSRITAVNNTTKIVTVATAYGVTESGKTWGIGGKRATLNHADTRTLLADIQPGWIVEIAAGDTQTVTAAWAIVPAGDVTSGKIIVRGGSGTRPIVTCATNSVSIFTFAGQRVRFEHLNITHTAGTRGIGIASANNAAELPEIYDCVIDGCSTGINFASHSVDEPWISCNEIKNCTSHGIAYRSTDKGFVEYNYIHDNGGDGINIVTVGNIVALKNVIVKNTARGIGYVPTTIWTPMLHNNTLSDNGSHGVESASIAGNVPDLANNLLYGNTGWGFLFAGTQALTDALTRLNRNNAFGSNSSGAQSGIAAGTADVALSANPFTNDSSSNRDFSLNNTAGGGAACRAAGFPGAFPGATFTGYPDIGAVQHADSGGGGGLPANRGILTGGRL